ncbi:hypothetical protein BH23GEM9_BH23GEM9_13850 [soil metagenome]
MTWEEWRLAGISLEAQMEQQRSTLPRDHPERLNLEKRLALMKALFRLP